MDFKLNVTHLSRMLLT